MFLINLITNYYDIVFVKILQEYKVKIMNINFNFKGIIKIAIGATGVFILASIGLFLIGNFSSGLATFFNEYSNNETFFGKLFYNIVNVLYKFGNFATILGAFVLACVIIYLIINKIKDDSF